MRAFPLIALLLAACPGEEGDDLVCPKNSEVVTLESLQAEVFDPTCKSCHNPGDPSSGDFSTAQKTRAATVDKASQFAAGGSLKIVDPGSLANSILWLKVLGGDATGQKGPAGEKTYGAMPSGSALTAEQKRAVKNWICSGAQ